MALIEFASGQSVGDLDAIVLVEVPATDRARSAKFTPPASMNDNNRGLGDT